MTETKCAAPQQQLRDITSDMVGMLEKANEISEVIEDKLFGVNQTESCDKACPPQNVQNAVDRSISQIRKLIGKLDNISSRL
jgi:hypothetical protein